MSGGTYQIEQDPRFALFLTAIATSARYGSRVREIAHGIVSRVDPWRDEPATEYHMRLDQLSRLLEAVQDRVQYEREPCFRSPLECWAAGRGDCKSSATLLGALAKSIGARARLVAMGRGAMPSHVVCQLLPWEGADWLWAETTVRGAELGEHPADALHRLRVEGRADV